MPPKKIAQGTLIKAINWSLRFFLDPKNRRAPTNKELEQQFPASNITQEQIESELKNLLGVKNLEEVGGNDTRAKVEEILEKTYRKGEAGEKREQKESKAQEPGHAPVAKRVGALGVLAELETIEPILRKHQQEAEGKLAQSLDPKVRTLLPTLGIDNPSDEVVVEIVRETARQSLADAARVKAPADATVVVVDSLRQTLQTHPEIGNQIDLNEEELTEKIIPEIQEAVVQNQQRLEQAAVLATAAKVASMSPENPKDQELIASSVEQTVREHAALLEPASRETLKAEVASSYLTTYKAAFFKNFKISPDSIPTLSQLQENKELADKSAAKEVGDKFSKTASGKPIAIRISPSIVTANVAQDFNLVQPRPPTTPPKIPTLLKFAFTPNRAEEFQLSAFGYDQQTLAKALKENSAKIDSLKKKRSLSYREKKELVQAQKNYARYTKAQSFKIKKPKKYLQNIKILSELYHGRPEIASQQFWEAEYYVQNYMPRIFASNERLAAGAAWGKLGFPGPDFGSIFSKIKGEISAASVTGMSITTNPVMGILKKIRNISALAFGGLLLYFMSLGQAALAGFIAGAAIGAGAGLAFGVGVSLALGPVGLIAAPVIIPLSMLTGGIIGGVAGGLIGLGIGSGSTTAVTTGIGAGVGGASGAVIGGLLGSALGPIGTVVGALLGAYIGAFLGGLAGYAIGQVIGAIGLPASGALAGASIGFMVGGPLGALVGAGIGWFVAGGWNQVKNFFSAGATAGGGILGSILGFLKGAISTIAGGVSSAIGGAFGALSGAANFVVGGLSSISIPSAGTVVFLTAGPVGLVGGATAIAITATAVSFATIAAEKEAADIIPGQNEFFTLAKTADKQQIQNPPPDQTVTFTVTLTAKNLALNNISVTDEMKVQGKANFPIPTDINNKPISPIDCPPTLAPNQSCTKTITISVNSSFTDSVITNTVTVRAMPEGKSEITDSVTAVAVVGNPPAQCPRGWPTTGKVTQGPEGSASHGPLGLEAIDIGTAMGTNVFATVEGTVSVDNSRGSNDQIIDAQPISCLGLFVVRYQHLSQVNVKDGELITHGKIIGKTGTNCGSSPVPGCGPHMHYQFNRKDQRNFRMAPPHIPQAVPRTCSDDNGCIPPITKAP